MSTADIRRPIAIDVVAVVTGYAFGYFALGGWIATWIGAAVMIIIAWFMATVILSPVRFLLPDYAHSLFLAVVPATFGIFLGSMDWSGI